jgi:dipeptidyl aminopeptidase/acylaminoacyl peptidase
MKTLRRGLWTGLCGVLLAIAAFSPRSVTANGDQTRLLRSPTISASHIAFAYANNIWTVERGGGMARRLTSFQGETTNPHYSPDGRWIAFSGEYAGNIDVYIVAAEGGEPKRLTWHPGPDLVQGWTPDGKTVVGAERRAALLDGGRRRRRRRADGAAACVSREDLGRRHAHRLPHEQLVGRGAPQLSRRAEPSDLDR